MRNGSAGSRPKAARTILRRVLADRRYFGKNVMILGGEVIVASGPASERRMDRAIREHPRETPLFVYVPSDEALILWLGR